jgi:hypothetical protein
MGVRNSRSGIIEQENSVVYGISIELILDGMCAILFAMDKNEAYHIAQRAIADLKAAVFSILLGNPDGISNAQLGRTLGIYAGHVGHEGHISRTLLAMLAEEGVAEQDSISKKWRIRPQKEESVDSVD